MFDGAWIAVTVKPLRERLVCVWLDRIGVEHTLPMECRLARRSRHQRHAKPKPIYKPALRGYVFLHVPAGSEITDVVNRARICPSVLRPVAVRGVPLVIRQQHWEYRLDPRALDPDRTQPRPHEPETPAPPKYGYDVGDSVVLTQDAGYWAGFRGRVDNFKDDEVSVAIEGLRMALLTLPATAATRMAA